MAEQMRECPQCRGLNGTEARFCAGCGFGLQELKCRYCSVVNPAAALFCNHCGNTLWPDGPNPRDERQARSSAFALRIILASVLLAVVIVYWLSTGSINIFEGIGNRIDQMRPKHTYPPPRNELRP